MKIKLDNMLISMFLVLTVLGLFASSAIIRIRNGRRKLHAPSCSKWDKLLIKLDILTSVLILITVLVLFLIFILNFGR